MSPPEPPPPHTHTDTTIQNIPITGNNLCYNHIPSGSACFKPTTTGRLRLRWSFQEMNLFYASVLSIIAGEKHTGVTACSRDAKTIFLSSKHPFRILQPRQVNCCYATGKLKKKKKANVWDTIPSCPPEDSDIMSFGRPP